MSKIVNKSKNTNKKNAANCQQSALSYVYDIWPKMVNRVKNGQKTVKHS